MKQFAEPILFASFVIALLVLAACVTEVPPLPSNESLDEPAIITPAPAPAIVSLSWDADKKPNPEWTEALFLAVAKSDLNKNNIADSEFCPKYAKLDLLDRNVFWAQLLSRMVKWESNYKPEASMAECRKDRCVYGSCQSHPTLGFCMKGGHKLDGGVVISRGLIQMSLQSSIGYGCELKDPKELHDPKKNLECAVKIIERLVSRDQRVAGIKVGDWRGGAKYWAVLRGTSDYTKKTLSDIKKYTAELSICK